MCSSDLGEERPIGWLNTLRMAAGERASRGAAEPSSPLLTCDTTLRDALSMLLGLAVQTGVVVDDAGRCLGLVSLQAIAATLRAAIEQPAIPPPPRGQRQRASAGEPS